MSPKGRGDRSSLPWVCPCVGFALTKNVPLKGSSVGAPSYSFLSSPLPSSARTTTPGLITDS